MADTLLVGKKAELNFGATAYNIEKYNYSGKVADIVKKVSGSGGSTTMRASGTRDETFSFDIPLPAGNTAIAIALRPGASGAFDFFPEADATGKLEFVATNAIITGVTMAGGVEEGGVLSITVAIDGDLTVQAKA